jgi:hypothetical protein
VVSKPLHAGNDLPTLLFEKKKCLDHFMISICFILEILSEKLHDVTALHKTAASNEIKVPTAYVLERCGVNRQSTASMSSWVEVGTVLMHPTCVKHVTICDSTERKESAMCEKDLSPQ